MASRPNSTSTKRSLLQHIALPLLGGALLPLLLLPLSLVYAAPLLLLGFLMLPGLHAWELWYDRAVTLGAVGAAAIMGVNVLTLWPRRPQLLWFVTGGLVPPITVLLGSLLDGDRFGSTLRMMGESIRPIFATIVLGRLTLWVFSKRQRAKGFFACGYDLTGNVSGTCPECGSRT